MHPTAPPTTRALSLDPLEDLWERWRAGRRVPARRDIDVSEIPPALVDRLALIDVVDADAGDFRIRLAGEAVREMNGVPLKGLTLRELADGGRTGVALSDYRSCALEARPVRGRGDLRYRDRGWIAFERLLLPFADGGDRVAVILAGFSYGRTP
jgi:hypothetical protein